MERSIPVYVGVCHDDEDEAATGRPPCCRRYVRFAMVVHQVPC